MTAESFHEFCLSLPQAEESTPFGPDVVVYKVAGKMFALMGIDTLPHEVNLKCDPERAIELRDRYEAVKPGYHMNKRHWNTVGLEAGLPGALLEELIHHSYDLVVAGLPKRVREQLKEA